MEAARAALADQALRIRELEQATRPDTDTDALRTLLELGTAVGMSIGQAPYRALLDGIVQAARRLLSAGAASILVLDPTSDELIFEAASGGSDVVDRHISAHKGIAGWVVMTGEAITVADVGRDPRFARDFAQATGYMPRSILAVPLLAGQEIVGVLEVLDKPDAATFGLDDIELLTLFARPAAIAVAQARLVSGVGALLVRELGRLADERGEAELALAARVVLAEEPAVGGATLEVARLVHRVSRHGERGTRLAIGVLEAVARYLDG